MAIENKTDDGLAAARRWTGVLAGMLMTASVAALMAAAPVQAQDTPAEAASEDAAAGETATEETSEERVLVTGSRVKRNGFDTPSPTRIIDEKEIRESGAQTLGDLLLRNPEVAVGLGISNAQTSGETAGATFANLRGLGSFRTLTLIDGRRRVPGSLTSSSVDLSSIPPSMIERVEIVTGGTSAVYGADAVTGVINVILKRDYQGFAIDASAGFAEQGNGGDSQLVSVHWGDDFDEGRGDINLGVVYNRSGILETSDRDFSSGRNFMFFETNIPGTAFGGVVPTYVVRRDPTTFLYANTGTFWYWNGSDYDYYTADPELRQQTSEINPFFGPVDETLGNGWGTGGDGFAFDEYGLLRGGWESFSGLLSVDYDINEWMTFYFDAEIADSTAESPYQPNFHPANNDYLYVYDDNPLLPASVLTFMNDNGLPWLYVQRTHDDLGVRTTFVDRLNFTASAGVKGDLSDTWSYDVFAQYGEMRIDTRTTNTLIRENYLFAIDAVSDGMGGAMCRDAGARANGCVPILALGRNGPITAAQRAYLLHDKETELDIDQTLIGGSVTGDLFVLPAGAVRTAAGFEYRDEGLSFRDDPLNLANALLLNAPTPAIDAGFDVWELYAEALVPILSGLPVIQSFDIEGAFRYSEYSHIGQTETWKLGASWELSDEVRFRYTRSKSVRAPTISDSFSPGITSYSFVTDPCDNLQIAAAANPALRAANCLALGLPGGWVDPSPGVTKQVITGGNPDLSAEESDSWTLGAILQPAFADRLRISADYWSIDLTDAISNQSVGEILANCVDSASIANDFCALVQRDVPGSGEIISISNLPVNIDQLRTRGTDVQVAYDFEADWLGGALIDISAGVTHLESYDFIDVTPAGVFVSDEAGEVEGTPLPQWRGNVSVGYTDGPVRLSWYANYVGPMEIDNAAPAGTYQPGFDRIPSLWLHNLYAQYTFDEQISVRGGVMNVFDTEPPSNPYTFSGAGGLYDNNGRYFWFGISFNN